MKGEDLMSETAKWTFMVYMAGDNNLSAAGDEDLDEMREVGSTSEVNVLVQFDNAGELGTRRFLIGKNGVDDCVERLGETDSGDPAVLIDFVDWAARKYPAERYALVLWNHGCGWEPTEVEKIAREVRSPGFTVREASERSSSGLGRVFFRTSVEQILSLPDSSERAICSDDGSGHSLDTIELGRVLARVAEILGQPVDLLGMDACLMSNLEVAYQLQPYVRYIAASEESEPADGWPYAAILAELVSDPAMPTARLAERIVALYIDSYAGYPGDVTQTAMDVAKVMNLAAPLDDLADVLASHMDPLQQIVWKAQRGSTSFFHFTLWDIDHFCARLAALTEERVDDNDLKNSVIQAANVVRQAIASGADDLIIAESHCGTRVQNCGGVTVYMPSSPDISRYYADLDFARANHWSVMLQKYLEA
jgi:hypothetical protein